MNLKGRNAKGSRMEEKSYSCFFGPFVAAMRRGSGLSQEELAKTAGIPKTKISKVERQVQPATFDDFMSLGSLLCDCPADLLDIFLSYVVEARQALIELEDLWRMDDRIAKAALDAVADKVLSEESNQ